MKSLKFLIKIGFTATLAYLFQGMFPWWSVAIASFLISFIISSSGFSSFLSGFLGIGLLWFILASRIDMLTESILTNRVAGIFSLPNGFLLILVTAIIGGFVGGFGALTGSHLRAWIMPPD